jgi:hypothetical protein
MPPRGGRRHDGLAPSVGALSRETRRLHSGASVVAGAQSPRAETPALQPGAEIELEPLLGVPWRRPLPAAL